MLRSIDVDLDAAGPAVVIGDNCTGKSTIVEAFELLRRASTPMFLNDLHAIHGGTELLTFGSRELVLGFQARVADPKGAETSLRYEVSLQSRPSGLKILAESLDADRGETQPLRAIARSPKTCRVFDHLEKKLVDIDLEEGEPAVSAFGNRPPHWSIKTARDLLRGIEVQTPFAVQASWVDRASGRATSPLRATGTIRPVERLELQGANLASAYHALANDFGRTHWDQTLAWIQLGLGSEVEHVSARVLPQGGSVGLQLKYAGTDAVVNESALSDGTLAFLAIVALCRLGRGRSLLVLDEPELHLHPELLVRALDFFGAVANDHPVVIATHSDRLLDALPDPASSVLLAELGPDRFATLSKPDPIRLERFLQRYRGLGDLRAGGDLSSVFAPVEVKPTGT